MVEAALWYENEREGLGADFSFEVDKVVARIIENRSSFKRENWGRVWRWSNASRMASTSSTRPARSRYLACFISIGIRTRGNSGVEVHAPNHALQWPDASHSPLSRTNGRSLGKIRMESDQGQTESSEARVSFSDTATGRQARTGMDLALYPSPTSCRRTIASLTVLGADGRDLRLCSVPPLNGEALDRPPRPRRDRGRLPSPHRAEYHSRPCAHS
jgi:hypothetical protein